MTRFQVEDVRDREPLVASTNEPGRAAEHRMSRWLFVAALCALLLVQLGGISGLDGETVYAVAKSAVDEQRLDVGPGYNTIEGLGGKQYARPNLGLPLVAAILYAVSAPSAWLVPDYSHFIRAGIVAASMAVVVAGIVVAGYWLARTLGARPRSALIAGIGTVAGTFLLPYSKEFFTEPLAALGIVIAIERTLADRPRAAGIGLAIAVLARAQSLLFLPVVLFVIVRRCGVRGGIQAAGPLGVALVLTAAYNAARFGNPLEFGYQDVGFTTPFVHGAKLLLVNPAKSLFVFVPIAVLLPVVFVMLWRRNRDALVMIGLILAITFVTNATWVSPQAGWSWGPRLLIPGVVAAVAAIGPWIDRRPNRLVAVSLFAVGCAVALPAVAISTQIQQLDVPPPSIGPTVLRQAELVPPTAAHTVEHVYEGADDGRNNLRYLTLWQVALARVLGPPGLVLGVMGSLLLVIGTWWAARRCRSAYRQVQATVSPP
jgi:hypothetical protein